MLAAEIEKRKLPMTIEKAKKDLDQVNLAKSQIDFEELQKKNAKRDVKREKRARAEVAKRVGSASSSRKMQRRPD